MLLLLFAGDLKICLCKVQGICLKFLNQVCKPRSIISPLLQTFCLISAHILDLIVNQYFSPWSYSILFDPQYRPFIGQVLVFLTKANP